jgi:diacylglycerol kinase (ATP)
MLRDLRTLVLANPASGRGRAARVIQSVEFLLQKKGLNAQFFAAPSAEALTARAASARNEGFECVAVLGGDGAVHFVLRGLFGTGLPLAIIPAGTGNDIAYSLGMPRDPIAAAEAFFKLEARPIDVLRARFADGSAHVYIGAGGCGLDAEANILANTRFKKLPGAARYIVAALWALKHTRPLSLDLRFDEGRWVGEVLFAAIANIPTYGAGIIIAPDARPDDGFFEITLVRPLSFARILEALPIVLRDGNLNWPEITRLRARNLSLRADRASPFHGDGELLGRTPVEIALLPRALQVFAPAKFSN